MTCLPFSFDWYSSNFVRPDVDDQVGLDDVDDLQGDGCCFVAGHRLIVLDLELTFQDAEERLCILIAPDAFGNIPAPILACSLGKFGNGGVLTRLQQTLPTERAGQCLDQRVVHPPVWPETIRQLHFLAPAALHDAERHVERHRLGYRRRAGHATAAVYRFGYVGTKRYLKLLAALEGTHATGTPVAALVIKGHGQINPQADQA